MRSVRGLLLFFIVLAGNRPMLLAEEPPRPMRWGVDDAGSAVPLATHPKAKALLDEFGFNFLVSHFYPHRELDVNFQSIRRVDDMCRETNIDWVANVENPNFLKEHVDEKGRDWYNRPDGRHFFLMPDEMLEEFAACEKLWGFMYDEAAHMQNCRNKIAGVDQPWVFDPDGHELEGAAEGFVQAVRELEQRHAKHGIRLSSEHVFPVLFHGFARAGWTAGTKVLKENWSPACVACALGAALQYDTELWITPDLWYGGRYPGHSTEEYASALLLAYHMGADCIYTENLAFDNKKDPQGGLVQMTSDDYQLTPWGDVTRWFAKEYMQANPRDYTFRDIRPRVAIVRRPDACWGQSDSWLPDTLFGHKQWPSNETTEAWLALWHLLSRGVIPDDALSWHNTKLRKSMPYQVFCPLDGVVVFDDRVGLQHLAGIEVIFLTGLGVTEATLAAIEQCVAKGATCVSLPHLLPDRVRSVTGDAGELRDGAGLWLATTDFLADPVRERVAHVIPGEDVIRYRFGDREVTLRPVDGDVNRLEAEVREIGAVNK
jgi:hypothetical protein